MSPSWPLERALFTLAGTMILVSVALTLLVTPWFLILTAFVGVNQLAYSAFGTCPAGMIMHKVFGLESACSR